MDYTKQCWCCGKLTMVPQNGYYQCSSCGATWNEVPVDHFDGLIVEPVTVYGRDTKHRPYRKRSRVR